MDTNNTEKPKILAIAGPTASGKTAFSVALAERLGGEIISCDSMQIYRGMDIGTAKPTEEERHGIPHYMIDIADPHTDYAFNCADYKIAATKCINDIISRGKLPIVCGGTGLYLDNLLLDNEFSSAPADDTLRAELKNTDISQLYAELKRVDAESAEAIHPNNRVRVERAVEIYRLTGITKTEWDKRSREKSSPYNFTVIGLCTEDREILNNRIRVRVDKMMADGLEDEVRKLHLTAGTTAAAAIGYKEFEPYFLGECTIEAVSEAIKIASTHYAKRQLTWFRHKDYVKWIETDTFIGDVSENIVNFSLKLIQK